MHISTLTGLSGVANICPLFAFYNKNHLIRAAAEDDSLDYRLICRLIFRLVILSRKCQKNDAHHKFTEPKVTIQIAHI